jgi:phosphoglycolate phosphatase-like HAD superfamily hydrolase
MAVSLLEKRHDFFVGIDSDGCVFDSMRVKQCIHFHPLIIKFWGLESFEKPLRACAEFVNLNSKSRGSNRFAALIRLFDLLRTYPGVPSDAIDFPVFTALKAYLASGVPLGNPTLKEAVAKTGDSELKRVYAWSLAINEEINTNMKPIPPFSGAVKALQLMQATSDVVVISQTPEDALVREWETHDIRKYAGMVAGLEFGTKAEQIRAASEGRYDTSRMLMLGDAVGDQKAAQETGILFYPIMPDQEDASWERFVSEAYPRFLAGTYAGSYSDSLAAAFDAALPETPPWQRGK